jgi:hypothetical protein
MNLLRIYVGDHFTIGIEVSPFVWLALTIIILALVFWRRWDKPIHSIEININLGGIGQVKMTPTWEDIQIAHQIWTEMVTRKAAVPVDLEYDVIIEIYDSWYALFQRTRQLIGDIPGKCVRREESTQKLVKVAIDALNLGLRPHLTKWQAQYRNWWRNSEDALKTTTPQAHPSCWS